jgi:hypothetical protein
MAKKKIPTGTPDPKDIFIAAISFQRATAILINEIVKVSRPSPTNAGEVVSSGALADATMGNLSIPISVNSSFSIELLLKCLHVLLLKNFVRGHNLSALFLAIPIKQQARIRKIYHAGLLASGVPSIPGESGSEIYDLDKLLSEQALTFEELRYLFEDMKAKRAYSLNGFAGSLIKTILEIKPEWSVHATPYKRPT